MPAETLPTKCDNDVMISILLTAQILALGGMVAVSVWGWKHLAADTRIRRRGDDATGIDWTMNKATMLLLTPVIGLLAVIVTFTINDPSSRGTVAALGLAGMVIFLWTHWSTVRRAAR